MCSEHKEAEQALIEAYRKIMDERGNTPEWAVHQRNNSEKLVSCTIPFIGKHYFEQDKKILVYASAENLTGYYKGNKKEWVGDWLDNDDEAINRHRKCFESTKDQTNAFPHVHIGPMNNGCLATAVMYIVDKLRGTAQCAPRDLYETIAFGNYGKYSKETEKQTNIRLGKGNSGDKRNFDYPTKMCELLEYSHAFIEKDIEILNPDYIIIPEKIYNNDKKFFESIKGNAKIIKIYQFVSINIHRHIPNREMKKSGYIKPTVENLPQNVQKVIKDITDVNRDKYMYVFSYLDDVIKDIE